MGALGEMLRCRDTINAKKKNREIAVAGEGKNKLRRGRYMRRNLGPSLQSRLQELLRCVKRGPPGADDARKRFRDVGFSVSKLGVGKH